MFLFWLNPSAEGSRINQQALYFLPNGKEEAGFRLICHSLGMDDANKRSTNRSKLIRTKKS